MAGKQMKRKLAYLRAIEGEARAQADDLGLELVCRARGGTLHWMFNEQGEGTGRRVVDYWPSNGHWIGRHGQGRQKDPFAVVRIASEIMRDRRHYDVLGRGSFEVPEESPLECG